MSVYVPFFSDAKQAVDTAENLRDWGQWMQKHPTKQVFGGWFEPGDQGCALGSAMRAMGVTDDIAGSEATSAITRRMYDTYISEAAFGAVAYSIIEKIKNGELSVVAGEGETENIERASLNQIIGNGQEYIISLNDNHRISFAIFAEEAFALADAIEAEWCERYCAMIESVEDSEFVEV
jgi:hypothetical protein